MNPIGVGIIGARTTSPSHGDRADGTNIAPSFADAVRLHRLVERIARGVSTAE